MSVRVRMAPSPTGFLHIGGVRTFLFNWLFARQHEGECLLRIENTDTSREVAESVEQIKESLIWLGIDWDGDVTFQLDSAEKAREHAQRLLAEGKAYEDDGAIRFRQPEGSVAWDDAVRGRIEFQNENLPDLVIVRSDGRPTYNFASPVEDLIDGITHVIRGEDHVSNTPSQINILRALGAELPVYAHVPNINGADGRKLSKRHGAVSIDAFRTAGYLPAALFNFLALLGWSFDDKTTIMSHRELVQRFTLDRVVSSPATFDYEKLDWMNGVYLRNLQPDEYAHFLCQMAGRAADRVADDEGQRNRAADPGEDREVLAVPRLRPFPLRACLTARRESTPASPMPRARSLLASTRGTRRRSRRRCARSARSSARSPGRRSRRFASRSPARRSRRGSSRASNCSTRTRSLARLAAASAASTAAADA